MTGAVPLAGLFAIPLDLLDVDPANPRGDVGDTAGLETSMQFLGVLDPLTVREKDGGRYEVVEGHRRRRAAINIGLKAVPGILRTLDPDRQLVTQMAIDGTRRKFDPMAEAEGCYRLFSEAKMSREAIAAAIGQTPNWVAGRLALVQLSAFDQDRLRRGKLSVGEALLIVQGQRAERNGRPAPNQRTYTPARGNPAPRRPAAVATPPVPAPPAVDGARQELERVTAERDRLVDVIGGLTSLPPKQIATLYDVRYTATATATPTGGIQ